ncbi:DUF1822 family protein [Nostoc sp.]|uniref:DUF1822 family protein n=1 Tax=Nostoc sp. TaxID=1180 RepID=UPI002FFC5046
MALEEIFGNINEKKFALRNVSSLGKDSVARAKIIDLGLQLGNQSLVLLVALALFSQQKVEILVQIHPLSEKLYLPYNLRINLFSDTRNIIQEVVS